MNKPATKEPSMDEILSSIRQIIADDDAAAAPPRPAFVPAQGGAAMPIPVSRPAPEPLALSAAQMLPPKAKAPEPVAPPPPQPAQTDFAAMLAGLDEAAEEVSPPMAEMLAGEPDLVDPEDIAFEAELDEQEPEPAPPPVATAPVVPMVEPRPAPRPASPAQAAPMPDPTLSSDLAEELLAPTTDAAVQGTMSRLAIRPESGIGGMTVEAMIRDMLKPMLKDWLDENLPALVERVVEKEIVRISRGVK